MPLHIGILDDEANHLREAERLLGGCLPLKRVEHVDHLFCSARQLFEYASSSDKAACPTLDILITDIQIGEASVDGISLVKRLFPSGCGTHVIYLTGFARYCTDAYQTTHTCFLLKPASQEKFDQAVKLALDELSADAAKQIIVHEGDAVIPVRSSRILYIESDKRIVRIVTAQKQYRTYAALRQLQDQLPSSFLRCHKSILVNMAYITELHPSGITLTNGDIVPSSLKRRREIRETYLDFLQGMAH